MKELVRAGLLVVFLASGLAGQAQTPGQTTAHAPDGGVMKRLESISIPPLVNAPFSAVVTTEWTTIMPDGSTATVKNHRIVARDSSGRIFEERRGFSPQGDTQPTRLTAQQYSDPNRHEYYDCNTMQKSCTVSKYLRPAMNAMPPGMGGEKACGCAGPKMEGMSVEHEALGQKTMENVDVTGSREITTIKQGQIGNQKVEPIVKEFWYSPRLGVNIVTKRFDPRSGIQNFLVSNVSLSEPNTKMFEPPADYQIVRMVVERPGQAAAKP